MSLTSGNDSNLSPSSSSVEHSPDSSFGSGSSSGSSSRFAYLWGYDGAGGVTRRTLQPPIIEVSDAGNESDGEDQPGPPNGPNLNLNEGTPTKEEVIENKDVPEVDDAHDTIGLNEVAAAAVGGPAGIPSQQATPPGAMAMGMGLEGFGRLSIGDQSPMTPSYPQPAFPYTPEPGPFRGQSFNHDEYGQLLSGVDMSPFLRSSSGLPGRTQYGFGLLDGPSMWPQPPFSSPMRDCEDRMQLSPESSRGNDFMRRLASFDPCTSRPNPSGLTIKQTIEQLKMLQELQEFANTSPGDPLQRRQISVLITTLQQHLMTQFAQTGPGSPSSPPVPYARTKMDGYVERAALYHREMAQLSSPNLKLTGILPPKRNYRDQMYSTKVFLGGLPWEVTENCLINTFKPFGRVRVEWPGKDGNRPKGYAYILFDTERQVKLLLQNCTHDYNKGADYIRLCSRYVSKKDIQVIPWAVGDSNFVRCPDTKLDPQKTIFVGALHGMLNAEGLCHIMQELFGGVVYGGIDTDRNKYPIGSGRITFDNDMSYLKAVSAAFIEIRTNEFTKKIQVDPYLEDATCSVCKVQQGPYFCRDVACFNYFCSSCFQSAHNDPQYRCHRPLMRNANKIGQPVSIMPTNFRARSSLTEISHSNSNGLTQRFNNSNNNNNGNTSRQWDRFYE